jgi:glutamate-5-semialdehyde dehydrogenase
MTLEPLPADLTASLYRVNAAATKLARSRALQRNAALQAILNLLKQKQNEILEANTLDLETSREMAVSEVILGWLKLTPEQLQTTTRLLQQLIALPDPLERMTSSAYRTEQAQTYSQLAPLGVVAFVYEAFPALAIVAAAMCIKTANSIILKGSSEGYHSNQIIADLLENSVDMAGLPSGCIQPLASDGSILVRDLIAQEQEIDLVIPYGRPNLVQQVVRQSAVPVLKSVRGNCYLFWSASGSAEVARTLIIDSHQGDPDAVNAIEKVLLHAGLNRSLLVVLFNSLKEKGFELRAEVDLVEEFPELQLVSEAEWTQPYLKKIVAFRRVAGLNAAIAWINTRSSCHADSIVTESYQESRSFIREVDSASTYINASPRFYRSIGNMPGGVSLGMSNQKGYCRGVIGLTALMTTKTVIQGEETVKND